MRGRKGPERYGHVMLGVLVSCGVWTGRSGSVPYIRVRKGRVGHGGAGKALLGVIRQALARQERRVTAMKGCVRFGLVWPDWFG